MILRTLLIVDLVIAVLNIIGVVVISVTARRRLNLKYPNEIKWVKRGFLNAFCYKAVIVLESLVPILNLYTLYLYLANREDMIEGIVVDCESKIQAEQELSRLSAGYTMKKAKEIG